MVKLLLVLMLSYVMNPVWGEAIVHDQEVCFAPDEPCADKLNDFISSAQQSIDMAIYDVNIDQLVHRLAVQNKKIKVRVVVDKRQSKGSHSLVSTLLKTGVDVRYGRQRGIMHDKFTIVDGKMLETGSFNYTNHASRANQENQIYLSAPTVVARFRERFEKMWRSAKPAGAGGRHLSYEDGTSREPAQDEP